MKDPNITTSVTHSITKSAWNIVCENVGQKYKIARIPYIVTGEEKVDERNRLEAMEHAMFISYCFNNSEKILKPII